jgi:hypothetical protein
MTKRQGHQVYWNPVGLLSALYKRHPSAPAPLAFDYAGDASVGPAYAARKTSV